MAKELKHRDAGTTLDRTEDNAITRHYLDSGANNDIPVYDSTNAKLVGKTAAEVKVILSLDNVENTVHSTDAHTMTIDGVDVSAHDANTTTAHGAVSAATASKHVVRDASARAKFAAPGAAGDALIKGTRLTADELPAVTDEFYLVGTGANLEERAVPGAVKSIVTGNYTGNDAASRQITTGFVCSLVIIERIDAYHRKATIMPNAAFGDGKDTAYH